VRMGSGHWAVGLRFESRFWIGFAAYRVWEFAGFRFWEEDAFTGVFLVLYVFSVMYVLLAVEV